MTVKRRVWIVVAALLLAQIAVSTAFGQGNDDLAASLLAQTSTGILSFGSSGRSASFYSAGVPPASLAANGRAPQVVAEQFLNSYGSLFGAGKGSEVALVRASDMGARSVLRYQQRYNGVPVLGGELVLQVAGGMVITANGEMASTDAANTTPTLTAEQAADVAIGATAKAADIEPAALAASTPELWLYNPSLLGHGLDTTVLVWRTEVTAPERLDVRRLVLVDAVRGVVVLQFSQVDAALDLAVFDANSGSTYPGSNLVCTESGCSPWATADAVAAREYLTDTYEYYSAKHGRDGIDGAGMQIVATVRYCPNAFNCPYDNAFWDGAQIVFGAGLVIDDVVAHELTHGVTQYESGLMYLHQSGAINEALSDFWGEMVDLSNGAGTDTGGVRWLIGEDYSQGAFRSMADPTLYGDPDSMTSIYYDCDDDFSDNGGVHSNSGVLNKAAYLMADGGALNGVNVNAIGVDATAAIMYELQTNLLTSGSGYADLYYLLPQACTNLVGTRGITADMCVQVSKAVAATTMDQASGACAVTVADACPGGGCTALFSDDLENPASGNWTSYSIAGGDVWYYPQNDHHYSDWDATYATSGVYNAWGDDVDSRVDSALAMTRSYTIPSNGATYLYFRSAWQFEVYTAYSGVTYMADGGVVEYSSDGGYSWSDVTSVGSMVAGYNGTIDATYSYLPYNNPLAGRDGFVGSSYGYAGTRVDISALAGRTVRFRFRLGTDAADGSYGWFIDDVQILTKGTVDPTPTSTVAPTSTPLPTATPTLGGRVYIPVMAKGWSLTPTPTATSTPGPVPTPNDPYYSSQWALSSVRASTAWRSTTGSNGPIVAVIDTGAALSHPDLAANLVQGYDFVNDDSSPDDDEADGGHGTHVAGIIGAVGNNGTGMVGMNWTARVMPIKVLDYDGSGWTSDVIQGIYYAVNHGARVINLSLGGPDYESDLASAVAAAQSNGCVVVAAAGNEGTQVSYPAAYDGVLAVGAVDSSNRVPDWSYTGSYLDVVAPGVSVLSTLISGYDSWSGTSMATPHVSGLAALIWAANPSLTRAQVISRITSTAQDLGSSGWDTTYGYGLIDAGAAVAGVGSASTAAVVAEGGLAPVSAQTDGPSGEYRPGVLLVQFESEVDAGTVAALSAQGVLAAEALSPYAPGLMLVTVPEGDELQALALLAQQPNVRSVGLDYAVHAM